MIMKTFDIPVSYTTYGSCVITAKTQKDAIDFALRNRIVPDDADMLGRTYDVYEFAVKELGSYDDDEDETSGEPYAL